MEKKFCPISERRVPVSSNTPKPSPKKGEAVCPLTGGKCRGCVII